METITQQTAIEQTQYIVYLRVSTQRQGASGLGLEAQRETVERFVATNGGVIVGEFIEVESGKKDKRVELARAIETANKLKAVLLVAKLDRLTRNVAFLFTLRDSGVKFVCADLPEMNTLTIGILAVFAQYERETISSRTKAALRAKKERGEKLGNEKNFSHEARVKGAKVKKEAAASHDNNRRATSYAALLREKGLSFRAIGTKLEESGFKTTRGNSWAVSSVKFLLDRPQHNGEKSKEVENNQEQSQNLFAQQTKSGANILHR